MVARGSGVKGADGDLTVQGSQLQWGTGSAIQQAIQAAMAAVQGLAGGNLTQAASGAAAPYLAEVIKQTAPDEASRIMAHAAVAGGIAAAQGNSALSARLAQRPRRQWVKPSRMRCMATCRSAS